MTNYKVVVLDMDDTLLNSDNVISEETANYLTAIQDEGYYVVLASGRPTEGMIPTARDLKLPEHHSYIISYNGSKTINMTNEEVEVSKSIGKQDFDEIVDYCRDRGFFVLTYQVLHQMWWVYNLKNYFKLQLLEFLLLGGQSIIGLGCLLFFSFV
ncbi:HAD hydrolase family protein [Staphylococcus aureus]|uniref:HAD hydrolase family protein n=1 Tax=Staphylococcus aureus TaxID=1280 RepID=UPI000450E61A|nr:hypothetical protein W157_00234 [Staphylococcus aureus DAR3769]